VHEDSHTRERVHLPRAWFRNIVIRVKDFLVVFPPFEPDQKPMML
jgi:hypothetical protein